MTKFKFGDKVWHDEFGVGVVILNLYLYDEREYINVAYENYNGTEYIEYTHKENLTKISDWIPCSERMPEYDSEVIVTDGNYVWRDKCYDFGDGLCFYDDNDSSATHWMPLPATPVEVE